MSPRPPSGLKSEALVFHNEIVCNLVSPDRGRKSDTFAAVNSSSSKFRNFVNGSRFTNLGEESCRAFRLKNSERPGKSERSMFRTKPTILPLNGILPTDCHLCSSDVFSDSLSLRVGRNLIR